MDIYKKEEVLRVLLFFISNALNVLFPIVTLPILTNAFSPHEYGSFAIAAFIGYYISLFADFGAGSFLISKFNRLSVRRRPRLVFSALCLQFCSWMLVSVLFYHLMVSAFSLPPLTAALGVIVGFLPIASPTWLFYANLNAKFYTVSALTSRFFTLACMLVLVNFFGAGFELAFVWLAFPVLIPLVFTIIFLRKIYGEGYSFKLVPKRYCKVLVVILLEQLKGRVASAAYGSYAALLASKFTTLYMSGLYLFSDRIRVGLQMCLAPFSSYFCSRISSASTHEIKYKLFCVGLFLTTTGAFFCFSVLFFFSNSVILILSNENYLFADSYLKQMSFIGFFASMNAFVVSAALPALKLHRQMIKIQINAAVLSFLLVGLLFYIEGIKGALYGVLCVEMLVFIMSLFCVLNWNRKYL